MPSHAQNGADPSKVRRKIKTRVITVSDRAASGEREDASGPLAARLLESHGLQVDEVVVVRDGVDSVREAIRTAIAEGVQFVLTTGGTGIGPRDLTPEATEPLLALKLDGLASQIRDRGLSSTPMAVLSRGLVGITERTHTATLIVNAPGSTGGVRDTLDVVTPLLNHTFDQISGGDH